LAGDEPAFILLKPQCADLAEKTAKPLFIPAFSFIQLPACVDLRRACREKLKKVAFLFAYSKKSS
jgi:hypothetical protein